MSSVWRTSLRPSTTPLWSVDPLLSSKGWDFDRLDNRRIAWLGIDGTAGWRIGRLQESFLVFGKASELAAPSTINEI